MEKEELIRIQIGLKLARFVSPEEELKALELVFKLNCRPSVSDEQIDEMVKKLYPVSKTWRGLWVNGFKACLKHLKENT